MSRRRRPFTPPASLIWLKAVSTPIFIWRPSSLDAPLKGAAIPNTISLSLTPLTALSGAIVCAGDRAAAFSATTEEALATPGLGEGATGRAASVLAMSGPGEGGTGPTASFAAFASGDAPFGTSPAAGAG